MWVGWIVDRGVADCGAVAITGLGGVIPVVATVTVTAIGSAVPVR